MSAPTKFCIGDWCVDPAAGQILRGDEIVRLEARTMRLLLDLAEHAGEVVSIDDLLDRVWSGVIVTPNSVYQAVASLRRLLGDDPKQPRYIATVPRLGYRMVATVGPWTDPSVAARLRLHVSNRAFLIASVLGAVALIGIFFVYNQLARADYTVPASVALQPITVGVLPILDMTNKMDHELLADDMTEGVIDKLSKNPALRTPGPRPSFHLKGKHATLAQAVKALGVAFVVDGSIHTSGTKVRVAARLIRADNGFIIWSQTYDRPESEMPSVEDAIAEDVAGTLIKAAKRAQPAARINFSIGMP